MTSGRLSSIHCTKQGREIKETTAKVIDRRSAKIEGKMRRSFVRSFVKPSLLLHETKQINKKRWGDFLSLQTGIPSVAGTSIARASALGRGVRAWWLARFILPGSASLAYVCILSMLSSDSLVSSGYVALLWKNVLLFSTPALLYSTHVHLS